MSVIHYWLVNSIQRSKLTACQGSVCDTANLFTAGSGHILLLDYGLICLHPRYNMKSVV